MKKILIFTIVLVSYFNSYSQSSFEKGYFIKNSGEKVECLIKYLDLLYNPQSFNYKLSMDSKEIKATIEEVKGFEIYNFVKYERHDVKIDRSSEIIDQVSTTRKVNFNEERLFLKVLIEGEASLYQYSESNFLRFFYKKNTTEVKQLVFKSFTTGFSSTIKKNEYYKQQLLTNLNCEKIKAGKVKSLKYRKSDLVDIFALYNTCANSKMTNYTLENSKKSKAIFNLNIKSGVNFSSFFLGSEFAIRDLSFENKPTLRFGFELEYVMPFNNNKWAFILEPTYNSSYKAAKEDTVSRETKIEYATIEIPFGLRHYMFVNENSKLFINSSFVFDIPVNSKVTGENNYDISTVLNYSLGIGYKYKDKISLELRTFTNRDLLGYTTRVGDFQSSSLILGYTIF
jgi:hypothetical protein